MNYTPFDRSLYNRKQAEAEPEVVVEQDGGLRLYLFDKDENLLGTRSDCESFVVEEGEYNLSGSVPIDTDQIAPQTGMVIGFYDIDKRFVLYEIKKVTPSEPAHIFEFYAEHAAMCELLDEVVLSKAVTNSSAGYATGKVLEGTRWELELDTSSGTASTTFYYKSVWDCIRAITEKWGCAFAFRWVFDGFTVSHRYVRVLSRLGADRGRRFELWKDINNLSVTFDDTEIVTAAYGRGKGEAVGTDSQGDTTYGRRINFADVEWSTASGDPVNKPLGQEYVENAAATSAYGRSGRARRRVIVFENITDPEELLRTTWEYVQEHSTPAFEAELSVVDLERVYGFDHEGVRVGDGVLVICDEAGVELSARVENISRDYIQTEQTDIRIGNFNRSATDLQSQLMEKTRKASEQAQIGAAVAAKNESLLDGMIDTVHTLLMSSGTNFYTADDGSFVWENDTRTRAVKITGAGILIAKSKTAGEWDWGTALTGNGIVADTITSGTLQATLIRILGSNMFYWDSANIHIFDPDNDGNEIRIGQYDGEHYGIAFTRDGGLTWASAVDFSGAHISSHERYSTVASSNTSVVFTAGTDGKTTAAQTLYAYITGYTGSTKVTPVISSITGAPSGMTATKQTALEDYSVPIKITVASGVTLGSAGTVTGQLKVHVTSPVVTDVVISFAKVNTGPAGANGRDGESGADGHDGADGSNGISSATITLYQRKSSVPTVPSGSLTYTFADGSLSGSLGSWYRSIPDGSEPCYSTTAFVSSSGPTATITSADWSTPTMAVRNGANGTNGKDGTSVTILGSYDTEAQLRAAHPTGHSGDSYIVAGDLYVWADNDWKNVGTIQGPAGHDGRDGTNGTNGTSRYIHIRYSANSSGANMVVTPTATTKYIGIAVTTSATAPTTPSSYTWSKYAGEDGVNGTDGQDGRDGVDGQDGSDGLSRADVYLYQRAASQPNKPTTNVIYTFQTGGVDGQIAPWVTAIPASNGNPCWMIKYTAIGSTSTVSIAPTDWSNPIQLVKDGRDGQDGQDGKDGKDGKGSQTYCQAEEPDPLQVTLKEGDLWFNTSNNNRLYRWNETTSAWVAVPDMTIDTIGAQLREAVADLEIAESHIDALMGASYVTNDGLQNTITTLKNEILANESAIETRFSKTVTDTKDEVLSDISTMIRASCDGVEVGRSDSNFKTLLTNDRLSFIQTENNVSVEVAYISDHKLYITDAQITNELAIGSGVHKLFKWRRTTNGLVLIYQS